MQLNKSTASQVRQAEAKSEGALQTRFANKIHPAGRKLKQPILEAKETADCDVCATRAGLGLASDTFHKFRGFNVSM